jgi:hypothetical protein
MAARKQKLIVTAVIVAFVCGAAFFGYRGLQTFSHTGEEAVTQMTPEERDWLARIGRLHKGMRVPEVHELLGEPSSDVLVAAKWDGFAGSQLSQLRVYFHDGHPRRLRWMKLGHFIYEKDL